MDKITFNFEDGLIEIENDIQKMTLIDEKLMEKKESIIKSAKLEMMNSKELEKDLERGLEELMNILLKQKTNQTKQEENTKKKIAIKKVGQEIEFIEVDATYRYHLKDLIVTKSFGTDRLENVYLNHDNTLVMIVDEDGHSKGYDLNIMLETTSHVLPLQEIRGDVLFARIKKLNIFEENIDYQIENLREDDIVLIKEIVERGKYLKYVLGK